MIVLQGNVGIESEEDSALFSFRFEPFTLSKLQTWPFDKRSVSKL